MALQQTVDMNETHGISHRVNAYFSIHSVTVDRAPTGGKIARVVVLAHASKEAKESGKAPVMHGAHDFAFDASADSNLFTFAYTCLKTLPLFAGAHDV